MKADALRGHSGTLAQPRVQESAERGAVVLRVRIRFELPDTGTSGQVMGTLVRDEAVEVGERITLNLQAEWMAREWEVVAIESMGKDGQVAATDDYSGPALPIWHGRIVLRPLG